MKKLEKKGLIKNVKNLSLNNRKVWMLSETEPHPDLTGGVIGQENFDMEVIELIQSKVIAYLKK